MSAHTKRVLALFLFLLAAAAFAACQKTPCFNPGGVYGTCPMGLPGNPNNYTCGENSGPSSNTYVCNLPSYLGTAVIPGELYTCGLSNQCFNLDEARIAAANLAGNAINVQCVLLHTGPSIPGVDALVPPPPSWLAPGGCVVPGNDNGMCAERTQMCVTPASASYASAPATQVCCPGLTCGGFTSTADTGTCCSGAGTTCTRAEECCLPHMDAISNTLICGPPVINTDVNVCCWGPGAQCDPNNDLCCAGGTTHGHCIDTDAVDTYYSLMTGVRAGPRCTCVVAGAECDDNIDCCDDNFSCMQGHCLPPPECGKSQDDCGLPGDLKCCAGLVCGQVSTASRTQICCADSGATCTENLDCCRGYCSTNAGGKCVCAAKGGACASELDCCLGTTCVTAAATGYRTCQ